MGIKTSTFSGVLLTGDAAKAFEKQFIENPIKHNVAAQATFLRSLSKIQEFKEKGYITVQSKK